MSKVRGYKVFNNDWTCSPNGNTKQYTCPGVFEENWELDICHNGMHFCKKAVDCFNYYSFDPNNKVAEVIALGDIVETDDKCATNKLEIVREIPWAELLEIVNSGAGCTGLGNSGDRNSGDWNSGDRNSGNRNSGNCNSGNCNSGNCNSGDRNSGNCNSGDRNSGDWNSGDCNSGDRNSGDWNKTCFSNGCFNTIEPKIYLFNKPSDWTYRNWLNSGAKYLLNQIPNDLPGWIRFDSMTDKEKAEHPEAETTGGYLKALDNAESAQIWWQKLSVKERNIIKSIPNFDKDIFKEIVGVDIDKN